MSQLKKFLNELGTNSKLLESYKENPDETMKENGLTKEEIDAVCSLDMSKIKSLVGDEGSDYLVVVHPHKHEHGF